MTAMPSGFLESLNPNARNYIMEESLKAQRDNLRKDIISKGVTDLTTDDMTLYKRPRAGCKHCHGLGRVGWSSVTGEVLMCSCTKRGKLLDSHPDEFMNAVELLNIITNTREG
jgi:hypothetical protein